MGSTIGPRKAPGVWVRMSSAIAKSSIAGRLGARLADGHRRAEHRPVGAEDGQAAVADVDHDAEGRRVDAQHAGRHPAPHPVGPDGQQHLDPAPIPLRDRIPLHDASRDHEDGRPLAQGRERLEHGPGSRRPRRRAPRDHRRHEAAHPGDPGRGRPRHGGRGLSRSRRGRPGNRREGQPHRARRAQGGGEGAGRHRGQAIAAAAAFPRSGAPRRPPARSGARGLAARASAGSRRRPSAARRRARSRG